MKKMNAFMAILMMTILPTVQAHAEKLSVDSAIDELSFALTVQWDQKDVGFKNNAINKFMGEVADLEKQGVTKADIVAALKAKMPDAQMAKDIDTLASVAKAKNLSPAETNKMVMSYVSKAQTTGASYSTGAYIVSSAVIVALIVVLIVGLLSPRPCYDYYGYAYSC